MNNRQRILAVLNFENYDRLPILHFGFLDETLERWESEGHFKRADMPVIGDSTPDEQKLSRLLGFDGNYHTVFSPSVRLEPPFTPKVLEELPGGYRKVLNADGGIVLDSDDNSSIPGAIEHILKGRKEWDEIFLPKLSYFDDRVHHAWVNCGGQMRRFDAGGRDYLANPERETHVLLHCGSLYGVLRDYMGMEHLSYLIADDPVLFEEMIEVNAELCYRCAETALASGVAWDIGHFWEDICYKSGPLVNPKLFYSKVGPHYRRITDLLRRNGVDLVSLDCDGSIDRLIPTFFENGVNVMFPIEVGTWGANLKPWREKYGRQLRGVGGMAKRIFGFDYAAIDAEIERLKELVDLGGYLPCPDHRIAPDAKWENVQYYCDKMRQTFAG
jgi:Uroporphyrinogen decarboxylase (URO-D)